MLQRKVCLLGAQGVGKRTIMSRFESNSFRADYLTTIGVQIAKKEFFVGKQTITMMIWDVADHEGFETTEMSFARGMSGYFLVADGTRPPTLERAYQIYERLYSFEQPPPEVPDPNVPYIQFPFRKIPFVLLLNKSDLAEQWRFEDRFLDVLRGRGWPVLKSSAEENKGVEEAFLSLVQKMSS
jgi:GTPase SAR1 family protein